jgi:hypothetical protein
MHPDDTQPGITLHVASDSLSRLSQNVQRAVGLLRGVAARYVLQKVWLLMGYSALLSTAVLMLSFELLRVYVLGTRFPLLSSLAIAAWCVAIPWDVYWIRRLLRELRELLTPEEAS